MDIYETVPILQSEDSLHEFWQSGVDHQRIINSFELIDLVQEFIVEGMG